MTDKEHWQGFAYANNPMNLTWKKLFPGAYLEPMKLTLQISGILYSLRGFDFSVTYRKRLNKEET